MSGRHIYLNIRDKLAQLLNPAICLGCGIPITPDAYFCDHCVESLARVTNPCSCCGQPNPTLDKLCPACLHQPPAWQVMIAPLLYQGATRNMIHRFKFAEHPELAEALVHHLVGCYRHRPVQALLPVPLHDSRLLERGFNQSLEIAAALSRRLDIPLQSHALHRIRATESQSGLSLNQRKKNLTRAFSYQPAQNYPAVAVIDDVITSGSTMSEICKLLRHNGIGHIEVWSLARALKHEA